ncbi:MAG: hypothetical protein AB7G21_07320 [Dehalococcoidia bacterium]
MRVTSPRVLSRLVRLGPIALLGAVALLAGSACDNSGFPARVQIGLQNTTGEQANMWVGHATEAPAGSQVAAKDSIFAWVEVQVTADKNQEGVYAKSVADCSAGYKCYFADSLLVNVAQGGKTESKKFELRTEIGDYYDRLYAIWDGKTLALSEAPAR